MMMGSTMKLRVRASVVLLISAMMLVSVFSVLPGQTEALTDDAWVTGKVTSDGVTPVPGAFVQVMYLMANLMVNYSITDGLGEYTIGVPSGADYMIFAAHGDYYMIFDLVTVMPGQTVYKNFTMTTIAPVEKSVTIKGYVQDEMSNPVTDGYVVGIIDNPMGGDMPYYGNWTNPNASGYFEVNVIPGPTGGGAAAMNFAGYPFTDNSTEDPLIANMTYWFNITLMQPGYYDDADIYGFVTDETTGLPLMDALVSVYTWNPYSDDNENYTFTNETGYFEINVVNGSGEIRFMKGGYSMKFEEIDISSGASVQRDAALVPLNSVVRGNVTDKSTGLPLSFANVVISDGVNLSVAVTNLAGAYELHSFSGTDMIIVAMAEDYSHNMTTVSLAPGDEIWMDFELLPVSAWLTGQVTDKLTGLPIEDAWVHVRSDLFEDGDNTNAAGDYNISLVPGTYEVWVGAMDYRENYSIVEVIDLTVNVHDVSLLPWDIPETTKVYGWINSSGSGMGVADAEMQVAFLDLSERNSTISNLTGYYEIYVAPLEMKYFSTGDYHAPEYGTFDATGLLEIRMDVVLDPDPVPPNVTYSQNPTYNITLTNPTVIDINIEEENPSQIALFIFRYIESFGGIANFTIIDGASVSFDPLNPYPGDLGYSVMGNNYSVHYEWNASIYGGWLQNFTDSVYMPASEVWMYGTDPYHAVRGYYKNDSMPFSEQGTALFDADTGQFAMFIFDYWNFAYPYDTSGVFEPELSMIQIDEMTWSMWNWMSIGMGQYSVVGLEFVYDDIVPSGVYLTVFWTNDFGNQGHLELTNMTVDNFPPTADAGTDDTANSGDPYTFDGSGSTDDMGIANYTWTFTDVTPQTLYGIAPVYTFNSLGIFDVTLTVTDGAGYWDTDDVTITVTDSAAPVADAGPDQTVDEDTLVTFDGSGSTDNTGIVNYTWTFDDGGEQTLHDVNPTYMFANPGIYTVTLNVSDAGGLYDTDTMTVTVNDTTPPTADAGSDSWVNPDTIVVLDGSGSWDYVGIDNYTWTFDDSGPQILYGMSPAYNFTNIGTFDVTLTVTDAAGNWDSDVVTISVITDTTSPTADAGADQSVDEDTLVTFDGSGSSDNIGISNYTWSFTDGTLVTLYDVGPTYTFATPGIYVVTLNVTDLVGNYDIDTVEITVLDVTDPIADAGPDQNVDEDTLVTFDGSGSFDNVGVANYTWTFDDGGAQALYGMSPEYNFTNPGIYDVMLNVTDDAGNWDADNLIVTVSDATDPVADAGADQEVDEDTEVSFNGTGSSDNVGISNYTWTFDDDGAQTLYGEEPVYTFSEPGTYTVTLNVSDAAGNWDTDTMTVTVNEVSEPLDDEPPVADAGENIEDEVGSAVTFDGSGSTDNVGIVNYTWVLIIDGETLYLYGVSPTYTFEIADIYDVQLIVRDAVGLTDTDTVVVEITEPSGSTFIEDNWMILVIVAVIVVAAIVAAMAMRGRKGGKIPTAMEEEVPPPPED